MHDSSSDRRRFERGGWDGDLPSVRSLTFDTEEGTYVAEFDDTDGSPSTAVISVIAEITGRAATDLRPLHHVVDPDALDRIVSRRSVESSRNERVVEFTYDDLTIRLSSGGAIEVDPQRAGKPGAPDE